MKHMLKRGLAAIVFLVSILLSASHAAAELADLADVPLTSSASNAVRPNLMYILDDSGSMLADYMPQNVFNYACKTCTVSGCVAAGAACQFTTKAFATSTDTLYQAPVSGSAQFFGEPPYFANEFNQMFYNPDISYDPAVTATGVSMGNQPPTAAKSDPYGALYAVTDTKNLLTTIPEVYYCNSSNVCRRNGIDNVQSGTNDYFLYYSNNETPGTPYGGYPNPSFPTRKTAYNGSAYYFTISAHEYCRDPNLLECVLANADGSAPSGYSYPAPLRYCKFATDTAIATAVSAPAGTPTPNCRKKYDATAYAYPRYGRFRRVNIVPGTAQYPLRVTAHRSDCANTTYCTYSEEIQNYANWYSYYRLRAQMMKSATGRAFQSLDDKYRVGFITINPGTPVVSSKYLPLATFDTGQKSKFYSILYGMVFPGGTPLRQALARVGRHYAGIQTGINNGMSQDPVQYSCQQNFSLLTSDGYWNETSDALAIGLDNLPVGNQDNVPNASSPFFVARKNGTLDGVNTTFTNVQPTTIVEQTLCSDNATTVFTAGTQIACGCATGQKRIKQRTVIQTTTTTGNDDVPQPPNVSVGSATFQDMTSCSAGTTAAAITLNPNPNVTPGIVTSTTSPGGTANTLADVAMYYYKTDLRTSGPLATNNVPTSQKDITPQQHMVTYTLGLGITGLMDYIPNYETSQTGDFAKIKNGDSGCSWGTGTCNWPTPVNNQNTTLDDLWHAAVNGRGTYYSASDPNTLAESLSSALTGIKTVTAAASASATSTPNITPTDNFIYSSTFRTPQWDGEITAQSIDPATGNVASTFVWSAQSLLDSRVTASSDTRNVYTFSAPTGNKLRTFVWANLSASEQAGFANKCGALSQCNLLSSAEQDAANSGANLVNYLRGQTQYGAGATSVYRGRDHVLGDSVNASPIFVRAPKYNFNDTVTPTYASFKNANTTRQSVLYVAANDGMLHAFNADTGAELWAYVPRMVFPLLPGLASENWDVNHRFIVDNSPTVMDVFDTSASAWKTILVAGLGKGGRGYYALDITDPNNPKGLWEACSDPSLCAVTDSDFGYSYGSAIITKLPTNGQWVALVTSGMNNVSPGTGRGFVFALDALTGAIVKKIDTGAGDTTTPSDFAKISGFANNYSIDNTTLYVYGGDLLGNLWSINMSAATPAVLNLAQLKDSTGKPQSITTRPELSIISGFRIVYVGTGRYLGASDLADPSTLTPALPWSYQQSFYAIKDRGVALGNIRTSSPGLVQQTITSLSLTTRSTSNNAVDWTGKDGWYVDFNPGNASPGERVNLDPQLIKGTLVIATAVPSSSGSGACAAAGGDGWFYQLNYQTGAYVSSAPGAIAGQKFTGVTLVGISVVILPTGVLKAETIDSTGNKTTVGLNAPSTGGAGKRVSWRELIQ
jgi:type IV pilus assembly protein PilY1